MYQTGSVASSYVERFEIDIRGIKLLSLRTISPADEVTAVWANPKISTVTLEPDIEPEVTQVAEFEIGYRVAPGVALNANAFFSQIDNTILYTVVQGIDGYSNTSSSGTKGFEIECLVRKDWGFANLNYSFYTADGVNDVEYYKVIDETV